MIYDYKSENTVQDVILNNIDELINDINSEYSNLRRGDMILIYTPSVIGEQIVGEILNNICDVWVHTDSHNELLYNDKNEVLISLASDGMIFIEEARSDFGTLVGLDGSVLTYVYDGFSKRDVDTLAFNGDSILVFGFDDDVLDKFEHYEINGERVSKEEFDEYTSHFKHNEKPSITSTVTYKVNDKECSKEEYEKALNELDEKYLDNVQDMLLSYLDFVSEMNQLRRLFW